MEYVIKALLNSRDISIKRRVDEHRKALELMSSGLKLQKEILWRVI